MIVYRVENLEQQELKTFSRRQLAIDAVELTFNIAKEDKTTFVEDTNGLLCTSSDGKSQVRIVMQTVFERIDLLW